MEFTEEHIRILQEESCTIGLESNPSRLTHDDNYRKEVKKTNDLMCLNLQKGDLSILP